MLAEKVNVIQNKKTQSDASRVVGTGISREREMICSYLVTKMQDKIIMYEQIINIFNMWLYCSIWGRTVKN
jgi:hypothetical protein